MKRIPEALRAVPRADVDKKETRATKLPVEPFSSNVRRFQVFENLWCRLNRSLAHPDISTAYRITARSFKVGVDKNGVVQVRSIYGRQGGDWWQDVFNTLTQ